MSIASFLGFNTFSKKLKEALPESEILAAAPSLTISVHHRGKKIFQEQYGEDYSFYDWASLTKIVYLASMWMRTFQTHAVKASDPLQAYWPEFRHADVRIADLLTHTSGLPWWNSYYKQNLKVAPSKRQECLEQQLLKENIKFSKEAVYSDVDMLVLGVALSRIYEKSWLQIWEEYASDFPKWQAHYNIVGKHPLFAKGLYAPTAKKGSVLGSSPKLRQVDFRNKLIQGEVHDPNTWSLGGVSVHAGIFGRIEDFDLWMLTLIRAFKGDEKTPFGDPAVVREFVKRKTRKEQGDFGYIFMKPSKPTSSAGQYFSADSFGHLGFTGTSTWYDPKRDLLVTILSNRCFNGPDQTAMRALRPKIHDLVVETLES